MQIENESSRLEPPQMLLDKLIDQLIKGPERGLIRPKKRKNVRRFVGLSWTRLVFLCFFRVLIIPKWLIKAPGHIPILFGSFLELSKMSPNLVPYNPYLSPKCYKKYKKYGNILKHILFHISTFWNPTLPKQMTLMDIKIV